MKIMHSGQMPRPRFDTVFMSFSICINIRINFNLVFFFCKMKIQILLFGNIPFPSLSHFCLQSIQITSMHHLPGKILCSISSLMQKLEEMYDYTTKVHLLPHSKPFERLKWVNICAKHSCTLSHVSCSS